MENANTKVAFFNIADLHAYHSLANRYDYFGETIAIIERLGRLVDKYKDQGYKCVALLNGDVAHRGSSSDNLNDYAVQAIKYLVSHFDETYLNLGNHEFTYYKNNPIWKFIAEIEDGRVRDYYPHIVPSSFLPEIRVVGRLEFEDFEIVFTPYKMHSMRGTKEYSLAIMHDDIVSLKAVQRLATLMPEYQFQRIVPNEGEFDYIFCGHNHLTHEKWKHGNTTIYNLASLGRSSVTEVDDENRRRLVPIILSEGGYFKGIAEEAILLHLRKDVVNEEKVELSREAYEAAKEVKQMKADLSLSRGLNPIDSLLQDAEISSYQMLTEMIGIMSLGQIVRWNDVRLNIDEEEN